MTVDSALFAVSKTSRGKEYKTINALYVHIIYLCLLEHNTRELHTSPIGKAVQVLHIDENIPAHQ